VSYTNLSILFIHCIFPLTTFRPYLSMNCLILAIACCIIMFINFYIARPKYCFIQMYNCGLTVVIKRICYVMLCRSSVEFSPHDVNVPSIILAADSGGSQKMTSVRNDSRTHGRTRMYLWKMATRWSMMENRRSTYGASRPT